MQYNSYTKQIACILTADLYSVLTAASCADPEGVGDRSSRPPLLKKHKNITILERILLSITKQTSQHSMLGHHRWRADDGSL